MVDNEAPAPTSRPASRRSHIVRLAIFAVFLIVLFYLVAVKQVIDIDQVRRVVSATGPAAPLTYVVMSAFLGAVFVPGPILAAGSGLLFGPLLGTFVTLGATVGTAVVASLFGRRAGRNSARELLGPTRADRIDGLIERGGLWAVVGQRFVPGISDALASYAFGAFGVPWWQMALGAFIGSVPRAFVYTALGASIGDRSSPLAYAAIAVWCVTAIVGAFAARRGYKHWRAKPGGDEEGTLPTDGVLSGSVTAKDEGLQMNTQIKPLYESLFVPARIGRTDLKNRVAVAPMTRVSATAEGLVTERNASYYGVYADGGFGLVITEGIYVDEQASQGYLFQPGIATPVHADAWRPVVERVHAAGAKIFAQLLHAGSQSQGNPHATGTLAPSAVRPKGEQSPLYRGSGPYQTPEAMTAEQIREVRRAFVTAARLARDVGFDGVEIHGANGYLVDEFLTDYLNTRTDQYGGSVVNRVRFAAEISRDIAAAVGSDITTGIRISQGKVSDHDHRWAGSEDDAAVIFSALAETGIDYLHTTEYRALAPAFDGGSETLAALAKRHSGLPVIANGQLDDPRDAAAIVESGAADVVSLAKPALANRNWPHLVRTGQEVAGDLPAGLLGPLATIKDWELVSPDSNS
jgi:2,4-dienoyl-CoA reductase-like NADH-dependent reductase (Old Yellow Enzyme family)/uncharacterized membrane protein YdjX (TVP38/TMEM64 family)